MRRALIGLVAVVALLVCAVPARGASEYPGQTPVTNPVSLQAIAVATNFWRVRGLTSCPDGVSTYFANDLLDGDGMDALGRGGNCEAWLQLPNLEDLYSYLDFPTYRDRRSEAEEECRLWTHEIGHALGLGHTTDGGVMDPVRWTTPYDCLVWADHLYPKPTKVRHATARSRKHHGHIPRRIRVGRGTHRGTHRGTARPRGVYAI